ncbi:MAG: HAMP domain-containing histidine kinase [Bacteroidetes bacterium]|nr:HAMP domain-containing histidine kinase [Bacteroidota bacterium]
MSHSLQQRNTRSLLTWLPLVMLAASVFFYLTLIGHIRHMKHQQLQQKQNNFWDAYAGDTARVPARLKGEYDITAGAAGEDAEADSANLAFMVQTHRLHEKPYTVTTYISAKEYRHLLFKAGTAEAIIFIVLLVAIVIVNRATSRKLWTPFYSTMEAVRGYDIRQNKPLALGADTGIDEFDRLNKSVLALIDNVDQAYSNQKQFTENASHELQTPLAIIRSKVELLIENPNLTEDNAQLLQEITEANERLSQMNKNLLLLTRIENSQFPDMGPVYLSALVERQTRFFKEYYENEVATTTAAIEPGVQVTANPALIEIMVNNLLRNAYIHNVPGGWVNVLLTGRSLIIINTGPQLESDPERLFDRFRKGRVDNRTTGLGLALVRQIAQLYRYDLRYSHEAGVHQLSIAFR